MPKRSRVATAGALLIVVMAVATAIATVGHQGDPRVEVPFVLFSILGGTGLALTGMLLLGLRPGHRLGPILAVTGSALVLEFTLREIAFAGGAHDWVPVAVWLSLVSDVVWFPLGVALVLLLFPDGRPGSARWAWVVRVVVTLAGLRVALRALADGPLEAQSHGLEADWSGVVDGQGIIGLLDLVSILMLPIAVASLVVRFRRSGPEDRQRLKPLGLAALVIVAGLLVQLLPGLQEVGIGVFVAGITVALPLALAVGALRYRVWDLDPVLVGTLVYTGLAVLVSGVYIAVVVVFAEVIGSRVATPDLAPSIAATALVAVLFGPTREYLDGLARRLVYGVRSSPYAVLNALPHQLAEAPAVTDVLPRTAQALARGLGVPAARVRAVLEDGTMLQSWSPQSTATEDDLLVVQVRHATTVVGDVAVKPSPDRPLGAQDRALLADLAAQAGPALRAVSLDAALHLRLHQIEAQAVELQSSRQRLVHAQIAERRRIERDIHDGAQQQLVGLGVRLRKADDLLPDEPDAARAHLAGAVGELSRCIDGLRELARGIYPPVLTARGLAAAVRAQVRTAPNEVSVQSTPALDQDRPPATVEVAAYFCCLEAIQNAAKHAPDSRVLVRLDRREGNVLLEVSDDGPGFDSAKPPSDGSGLVGMRDRVGAAGGVLEVVSTPAHGTTVRASIPLA